MFLKPLPITFKKKHPIGCFKQVIRRDDVP